MVKIFIEVIDTIFLLVNFWQKCYISSMESKEFDKKQKAYREIGRVLVNFGNLTFASLVLGTIIKGDYNRLTLLLVGGVVAVMFIALGVITLINAGGEK